MKKDYGTPLGYCLLTSNLTPWRGELDVLYMDDTVLVLRDWPNTPLPRYFIVARELNNQAWKIGLQYMATINTGGIQLSVFPPEIESQFEKVVATFITLRQAKEQNEQLKRGYAAFVAAKRKE